MGVCAKFKEEISGEEKGKNGRTDGQPQKQRYTGGGGIKNKGGTDVKL